MNQPTAQTSGQVVQDIEDRARAEILALMPETGRDLFKTHDERVADALIKIRAERVEKQAAERAATQYAAARQRGIDSVQPLAAEPQAETPSAAPVVVASASNAPVVPFKKSALVAAHVHEWPTIESDISDAATNGLAATAKAGARGWWEDAALIWARANGKLISAAKTADSLAQAMHNMGNLPSRKHTLQG